MSPLVMPYFLAIQHTISMETSVTLASFTLPFLHVSYCMYTECVAVKYVHCKYMKIKRAQTLPLL